MKFVFLTGGFVGFVLAALSGLAAGRDSALVLRDAAIGCFVGALLFRWFWSAVVNAVSETRERRRQEALAAAEAKPTSAPSVAAPAVSARAR